ncbi:MAG: ABC transporter ATP-binding protein [Candidatus Marinimicrobia bacterium]|jgi:ATP-binding cassette, subfamily B, bacterial|nr:ABC transporter ATP-binding protein [Candidatus Neomarinimicrobiota bacterium]MBT6516879.1 ABC transporter ATP-binding protein [Candidatus Neomarinimicrobiota bacterium]MBT6712147.1 ABC transporter ATP-binding protein [Candidatus Neomarinimicrobiota bacterium]MBT7042193.1 ABC transporter ATP-binding protein [Candidatus Neomarinimicrobiota bacterium]MBT7515834.1 ABC transporter ATP-binding protein [Candidatus Neomarinimicrobiota bacterium]
MKYKLISKSSSDLLRYLKPWRFRVFRASIFSGLNKIFDIAPEVLIGVAVDLVVKRNESFVASLGIESINNQVLFLGGITFVIWALESLFEYLYLIEWRSLAQKVEHSLRVSAYDHAQRLELNWHEKQTTGNISAILNDDVNQLERFLNNGVNQIIQVIISTIIIGFIFFYISPLIASIAILPVPIIFFMSLFFQKKLSPRYKSIREKVGILNSSIINNLMGIQTIKSFMTFDFEKGIIKGLSDDYQKENIKAISISSAFNPLIRMGVLAGFLGTILIGSHMALNNTIEVGSYSVLVFLTQRFLWPFTSLSTLIDDFERSMASSNRIFDLIQTKKKIINHPNAIIIDSLMNDITFNEISFNYDGKENLFKNFNLRIPFGSSVGIVGDTGSGKTTIAKLLLRLYEPTDGSIYIGKYNINEIDINSLRKKIGIVSQDSFLFNSTIKNNISYGITNPLIEDIEDAAIQSQSIEFIDKLPFGFDTAVGERGQTLSGGQQQRIAIARTLMRQPDIIIFDEATSSVDNKTEQLIQQALFDIRKGRTSIIIAHRLSTIRNCSNIFVLKDGEIIEEGNHDYLVSLKKSYYSQLWNIQTGKQKLEVNGSGS